MSSQGTQRNPRQLKDEYTHTMILEQKYREKVEVALAQYLEPSTHGKDGTRVNLFENTQHYQAMAHSL